MLLARDYMAMEQQQRDLDMQLNPEQQVQSSSTFKITADMKHAVVMVVEQPKGLKLIAKDQNQVSSMNNEKIMLLECKAHQKTRICVEDNTKFAYYEAKLSTAMEVVGIEYTEPKAEVLSNKNLSGIEASIVQISTASAQLAMMMVVEQAKPEKSKYTHCAGTKNTKPELMSRLFPD